MAAKIRFAVDSRDENEVYTTFNIHDDRLYVETLNQSLGVVLQKAYYYYSPTQKDNLLSIGELKKRIDEARSAREKRIPYELAIAKKQVSDLEVKLKADLTDKKRMSYEDRLTEAKLVISRLEAEDTRLISELAMYEHQRALRSSTAPKAKMESPELALVMRAIRSLNNRNKKSEDFIADFMEYAATFHKQTEEEKFNEDIAASGVTLNFRPMPAKRAEVVPRAEVAAVAPFAAPSVLEVEAMPAAAMPAAAMPMPEPVPAPAMPAAAPPARQPRAPQPPRQQERKGPSKSDRLAALLQGKGK
jgi:hypothetical protein